VQVEFLPQEDEVEKEDLKDTHPTWRGNPKGTVAWWESGDL
jgi:hypothetical protein